MCALFTASFYKPLRKIYMRQFSLSTLFGISFYSICVYVKHTNIHGASALGVMHLIYLAKAS